MSPFTSCISPSISADRSLKSEPFCTSCVSFASRCDVAWMSREIDAAAPWKSTRLAAALGSGGGSGGAVDGAICPHSAWNSRVRSI